MTDKERLEEIKEDVKMTRKDLSVSPSNEMTLHMGVMLNSMDWLIEQVEKNMTCQEVLDLQKYALKGLLEQNKRYREALEFYADREKYFVRMDELELPEDILHAKPRITYDMGRKARKSLEGEGE